MLTWTQQRPNTPGWYWMLSPSKESNLPTIVQIVFRSADSSLVGANSCFHYPNTWGTEIDLQSVDAMWAGPLEVPSVLAMAS